MTWMGPVLSTFDLPSCREGGLADQLEGSAVRFVARPLDLSQLSDLMREAHERGLVLLPRGSGSKLGWLDLPPIIDVLLDLSAFATLRYDRESTGVTAGSAVQLLAVQDVLGLDGRRVALDPGSMRATVGGVTVAGEFGPMSHQFGPPAAHVIDATVVLPDGTVTSVADRVRLLGGSVCDLRWVYPGWPFPACAVVDVTLRTDPWPQAQSWLTFPVSQPLHMAQLRDEIIAADLAPVAMEIDVPGMRRGAAVPGQRFATGALSVLFEGSEADVLDRVRELSRRMEDDRPHIQQTPPLWWGRYPFRAGEIAMRLHTPDGRLHSVCYALADAAGAPVPVRGSVGSGHGWAALPGDLPAGQLVKVLEAVREVLLARGGTAVVQAAPLRLKEIVAPYRYP